MELPWVCHYSASNNNSNKPMQLKLLKRFVEWIFHYYGMSNTSLVMTTYYLWVRFLTIRESKSCKEDSIYLSFYLLLSCIGGYYIIIWVRKASAFIEFEVLHLESVATLIHEWMWNIGSNFSLLLNELQWLKHDGFTCVYMCERKKIRYIVV